MRACLHRLSLQRLLLLGHLSASLPPLALVGLSGDWNGLHILMAAALSTAMACLLARCIATPIGSITAGLRRGQWPPRRTLAPSAPAFIPAEVRELLTAYEQLCRPHEAHQRRATDVQAAPPSPVRSPGRLIRHSQVDTATGLANRRGVAEHLANVDGASPLHGTTAIHCLAITNLTMLTQTWGQDIADAVVRATAKRLTENVRPSDLVARIGAAEFAIVQHDVHARDNELSLAQRIGALMCEPLMIGKRQFTADVSIGIALATSESGTYTARLIEAEAAMRDAKHGAPGSITVFAGEVHHPRALDCGTFADRSRQHEPS